MADALFPTTRQRVLGLLFGQPDRQFGIVELIELAGVGRGAVQREVEQLVEHGLVSVVRDRSLKRYQANRSASIFEELRSIVEKTTGVAGALRDALAPIAGQIELAILYGSVATARDRATSDIDVLVVSDTLTLEAVFEALQVGERRLGRSVNPTLYTSEEWRKRRKSKNAFVTKLMAGPFVTLVGSEDAIGTPR